MMIRRNISATAIVLVLCGVMLGQTKSFIPVEGRLSKDEAIPILIRTARNHPKMAVRKVAIQVLGQTGDERAVAFFRELLSKD